MYIPVTLSGGMAPGGRRPEPGKTRQRNVRPYSAVNDSQNTGIEIPARDTTRSVQSAGRSRRNAAHVPRATPRTMEMAIAVPASSRVAGAYSARSSRTGRRLCCESPRSPWARLARYVKYCTGNGLSRPYRWLNAATASGSSIARCPRLAAAGSPGTTLVSRNVTNVMPSNSNTAASSRRVKKRPMLRASYQAAGAANARRSAASGGTALR